MEGAHNTYAGEAASMLRHREGVYWSGVRYYTTLVTAVVGGAAWIGVDAPSRLPEAFADVARWLCILLVFLAASLCLAGGAVATRQGDHLELAWSNYRGAWDKFSYGNTEGPSVRRTVLLSFWIGAVLFALAAALLVDLWALPDSGWHASIAVVALSVGLVVGNRLRRGSCASG